MVQERLGHVTRGWQYVEVPLEGIDRQDETYARSFPRKPPPELLRSIAEIGVTQPVFVSEKPSREWRIIHGFRRFWAALDLGIPTVPAFVIDEAGWDARKLYEWTLLQDLGHRRYNRVELALVLRNLRDRLGASAEELVAMLRRLAGLGGPKQVERLLRLPDLEPPVLEWIVEENPPDDALDIILSWPPEDRLELAALARSLRWSSGEQREVIRLLDDLAQSHGQSPSALLKSPEVALLLDRNGSPSQKTQRLIQALRAKRFPIVSQLAQEFREIVSALKPPRGVQLEHSPSFESEEVLFHLRARSPADFSRLLEELARMARSEAFPRLFCLGSAGREPDRDEPD
ncbi:MAG: ParB N-terminal domain-containing protein [candidate division KSB1 bacterium]|nr:ParB N-terminal domain-containing protein [candidate division KSB1 bacterium]